MNNLPLAQEDKDQLKSDAETLLTNTQSDEASYMSLPNSSYVTCARDSTFYSCIDDSLHKSQEKGLDIHRNDLENTLISSTPKKTSFAGNSVEASLAMDFPDSPSTTNSETNALKYSAHELSGDRNCTDHILDGLNESLNEIINDGILMAVSEDTVDLNIFHPSEDLNISSELCDLEVFNNINDISFNNISDVCVVKDVEGVEDLLSHKDTSPCKASLLRKESSIDILDASSDGIFTDQQEGELPAESSIDILPTTSSINIIGSSEPLNTLHRTRNSLSNDTIPSIRSSMSSISILGTSSQSNKISHFVLEGSPSDDEESEGVSLDTSRDTSMMESCETVLTCFAQETSVVWESSLSLDTRITEDIGVSVETSGSQGTIVSQEESVSQDESEIGSYSTHQGITVSDVKIQDVSANDASIEDAVSPCLTSLPNELIPNTSNSHLYTDSPSPCTEFPNSYVCSDIEQCTEEVGKPFKHTNIEKPEMTESSIDETDVYFTLEENSLGEVENTDKNMYPEVVIKPVLQIDISDLETLRLVEPVEYSSSLESTPDKVLFDKVRLC